MPTPSSTRRRPPSPPARRAPTTATPSPSIGGWPSAAPISRPASGRCGPTSGSPAGLLTQPTTVAVRRRGGAGRAGGAVAGPVRRVPPRRADQRPRPRRPRAPRAVDHGAAGGRRARQPRPHVPREHGHRRPRDRRVHPPRHGLRRWLAGLPRRARGGAAGGVGALRGVRHEAARAGRSVAARAGVGAAGPGQGQALGERRAGQEHPRVPRQPDRAARRTGGPHGAGDGAPGRRRQAAPAVGAAPVGGLARPHRRRRRPPRRRGRRTWRLHARADRPRRRHGRARRARRRQRLGQDDAARRAARAHRAGRRAGHARTERRRRRGRAGPRPARRRRPPCCAPCRTPPAWTRPPSARCSPSSASSPTT